MAKSDQEDVEVPGVTTTQGIDNTTSTGAVPGPPESVTMTVSWLADVTAKVVTPADDDAPVQTSKQAEQK